MAFDTQAHVVTHIQREDGRKEIEVRWPTDEEWLERNKGWSLKVQKLGRGQTTQDVESGPADLALYNKIRNGNSPDLSALEAQKLIANIEKCEVIEIDLGLDEAVIHMLVVKNKPVTHTLRIPTTAEIAAFQRTARKMSVDLPHGASRQRLPMSSSADLWEKCLRSTEGYANGVPIVHRDVAMRALIADCEREAEASDDEDF